MNTHTRLGTRVGRRLAHGGAATAAAAGAGLLAVAMATAVEAGTPTVVSRGQVSHLDNSVVHAFDAASAQVTLASSAAGATATLHVWGVSPDVSGRRFGAHLHNGPCVTGSGGAAGGHYNSDAASGQSPVRVSDDTEVWLDFTVNAEGRGAATAVVPFTPVPGARSVVIHAQQTDHLTGLAGARVACLPVVWQ